MIGMVSNLLKNNHAYENKNHVYFSVSSFKKYGKLSNKNSEQLVSGSRVEVSEHKKTHLILFFGNLQTKKTQAGILHGVKDDLAGI